VPSKLFAAARFPGERPFLRELSGIRKFEPISRSHDGFIDILHVGIEEKKGYFYYVMEAGDDVTVGQRIVSQDYVPKTLAKRLKLEGPLPLSECVSLGLALTLALNELHKHGLVPPRHKTIEHHFS
jgi:serine/threonine protein kinase